MYISKVPNTNVRFSLMFLFSSARIIPDDRGPSPTTMVKQAAVTLHPSTTTRLSCSVVVLRKCASAQSPRSVTRRATNATELSES
ncbi:hypothetical protein GMOD_00004475 [Pyrenophora seminiperda CCB06]|uniref:Uncharacterized protein n=1 Tax=Pyrenophora seminiperda CCB06 TaxID=1302712 RepID=A0A3M7M1D9_9PLEO|nr:hypothetical protein GMOD_00004475 [Pyrenophora seminiperda CCB06]